MHKASAYENLKDKVILCGLCPHNCRLPAGKTGICGVRSNIDGQLIAENYGKLTAIHKDPIEKKPLYHFFPGRNILSIGSVGCNLKCAFCQNCEISQARVSDFPDLKTYKTESIVDMAISDPENLGIAYTYNEPTVFYEFMLETALLVKAAGLKNVVVSNGYINAQPLQELLNITDAFNIDLKGFNEEFFRKYTQSSLGPVLESLIQIRKSGKHLEITNLLIPGLNDEPVHFKNMVKWISDELGPYTIFHISRYFPRYKLTGESTSYDALEQFASIAREFLSYVYVGNASLIDQQDTICHNCQSVVIKRNGYVIDKTGLTSKGHCKKCNTLIVIQ